MKKVIAAFVLAVAPALALASSGEVHLEKANVDLHDQAALQRGAKLFSNYCLSCHSAKYQRYNRMGRDIGLTDEQVKANLMFAGDKVGETMTIAMDSADAKRWFGNPPPDLTLEARLRGTDWVYTYLKTFYIDESRPFGVNNAVFKDVGMPHILWELEGLKKQVTRTETDEEGNSHTVVTGYEMVKPGKMTEVEYDQAARDLTTFLAYMGEPIQLERKSIGIWVIIFLIVFTAFAYALKKEYWKDVH